MAVEDQLSSYFSSSERSRGEDLAGRKSVIISSASDTGVRALIRASTPAKVSLDAMDVAGPVMSAQCTCPVGRKGNLCRHVWAVLLTLEEKGYDFLEGKESVGTEPLSTESAASPGSSDTTVSPSRIAAEERATEYKEKQKVRAKEYRQQNAEKLKTRQKEYREKFAQGRNSEKASKKNRAPAFSYPEPVEEARLYFQANGFTMSQPIELEELLNAKKQLSRVFHPDKGGTHDEILELNENFQMILDYLKS